MSTLKNHMTNKNPTAKIVSPYVRGQLPSTLKAITFKYHCYHCDQQLVKYQHSQETHDKYFKNPPAKTVSPHVKGQLIFKTDAVLQE